MAQDQDEDDAIVVTGTRLVRQDFEAIFAGLPSSKQGKEGKERKQ